MNSKGASLLEKKNYYVSVQAGTVLENQGDTAYEFEIQATAEEVEYLQQLLSEKWEFEHATVVSAYLPGIPYHQDDENVGYDNSLRSIYGYIHKLGNGEAKQTIDSMGLEQLGTPYPDPASDSRY